MLLGSCLGYSQAKLCAWNSKDGLSAFVLYALIASVEIVMAGFIILPDDMPTYVRWITMLMFTRWSCSLLVVNEFDGFKSDGNILKGIPNDQGEYVLKYLNLSNFHDTRAIVILICYWVALEAWVMVALWPPKSQLVYVSSKDHPLLLDVVGEKGVAEDGEGLSFAMETTVGNEELRADLLAADARRRQTLASFSTLDGALFPYMTSRFTNTSLFEPYNSVSPSTAHQLSLSSSRVTYTETDEYRCGEPLTNSQRARLTFRDITYTLPSRKGPVKLLQRITGTVSPGEMVAIMGSR